MGQGGVSTLLGQGQVGCGCEHPPGTQHRGTGSRQGYCAVFSSVAAPSTCLQQDKTYVQYLHVLFNVCKQMLW